MQLVEARDPADYLLGTHGQERGRRVRAQHLHDPHPEWNARPSPAPLLPRGAATARAEARGRRGQGARGPRFGVADGLRFVQALCDPWRERLGCAARSAALLELDEPRAFLAGLLERVPVPQSHLGRPLREPRARRRAERKLTRPAEVVYFEPPGAGARARARSPVVSPIYLLRSFMYWRLPPSPTPSSRSRPERLRSARRASPGARAQAAGRRLRHWPPSRWPRRRGIRALRVAEVALERLVPLRGRGLALAAAAHHAGGHDQRRALLRGEGRLEGARAMCTSREY